MRNDFGTPFDEYLRALSEIRVPMRWPTAPRTRGDIWPIEAAPVIRRREDGVELVQLRRASWRRGPKVRRS